MRSSFRIWILPLAVVSAQAAAVSYQKQIQPIIARHCQGCHQPASKQADLDLTTHASFLKGGKKGPGFLPGKPAESTVIAYLTGTSQPQMPLGGKPLPNSDIDLFKTWILEGGTNDAGGDVEISRKTPDAYRAPPLVTALAFSPDRKLMAVSGYHEVLILNPDGALQARLPGASPRIHSVAFSPDGQTLLAVGGEPARYGELQIWDVAARKQKHSVKLTTDTLSGAAFSPDGTKAVFTGLDKTVRLFDVATGQEIRKMDHHEDWVFAAVFGIDGKRIVSVGRDRAAKLIDANTGSFIENVNLLKEPLTAIARHPKKDWVLIGGQERIPYLYRMDRPRAMRIADDSTLIRKFEKQDGPILALAISGDGLHAAVASEAGDVRIYNLETGEKAASCSGHQGGIYSLAFHPDGKSLYTAGFDGLIRSYDLQGKQVKSITPVPLEKPEVASAK